MEKISLYRLKFYDGVKNELGQAFVTLGLRENTLDGHQTQGFNGSQQKTYQEIIEQYSPRPQVTHNGARHHPFTPEPRRTEQPVTRTHSGTGYKLTSPNDHVHCSTFSPELRDTEQPTNISAKKNLIHM